MTHTLISGGWWSHGRYWQVIVDGRGHTTGHLADMTAASTAQQKRLKAALACANERGIDSAAIQHPDVIYSWTRYESARLIA